MERNELIEKMAMVLCEAWFSEGAWERNRSDIFRNRFRSDARAALSTLTASIPGLEDVIAGKSAIVPRGKFSIGDRVEKPKGAYWEGVVVGFYSTRQTPMGYAVQLPTPGDNGPVQIYPESALSASPYKGTPDGR